MLADLKRLSIPKSPACARRSCCRLPWLPQSFSHGPFPTGGRQRLLSRQGGLATEIRAAADLWSSL